MATYQSLKLQQNNKTFYITTLDTTVLKEIAYVLDREEDSIKGFQRVLNTNRAKDIAKYMDSENGVIPSPLILSAQPNAQFKYDQKTSKITFDNSKNSFLVLDGQHRLYGMFLSEKTHKIPVIIFNELKTSEEVNLFIDINTNQKGVPTTLLIDIKNLSGKESKKEEKQRDLFDLLNKNSVISGLMSATKSKAGKISKNTFNQATSKILDSGYFSDEDTSVIYKALKNYLEASEIVLLSTNSDKAKLTKSMIFRALFEIFNEVVELSFKKFNNLKLDSLIETLSPIGSLNFDNHIGSSNSVLVKLVSDMKKELYKSQNFNIDISNDIF
ncbi:DGQHR domain-containing protein [Tenacibaculum finnmarkense]|uniref:DGQHR domain-containing protein n=1 Tax=Tenacibaculum finnmarkense TaxID=2781243 RepID=UPI001EFAA8F3|nr:DGQHR domain-containing protein [Tenacibaculum finnmarkense]MCG8796655.1 DGQHR domain-containing protein [Tenacibaculum finnmarkense]MCG8798997.1 DGQHR domain-containing protein [Tenacibaculum finnmarkense]